MTKHEDKVINTIKQVIYETPDTVIRMLQTNRVLCDKLYKDYYKKYQHGYYDTKLTPEITLLTCSDPRLDTYRIWELDEHSVYQVRNYGGRLDLNHGCIDFGVRKLKTPILAIVGMSNSKSIHEIAKNPTRYLDNIRKYKDAEGEFYKIEDVLKAHIEEQVLQAGYRYKDLIETGKLYVIGMIYDIANWYGQGAGYLIECDFMDKTNIGERLNDEI